MGRCVWWSYRSCNEFCQDDLKTMKCRLCSSPDTEQWTDKKGKIYHYCGKCGIIQLDTSHILSPIEEKERYLRHNNTPENNGYISYLNSFIDSAVAPYVAPGERILDFGSGPLPVLSDLLTARGYSTISFDPFFNNTPDWRKKTFDAIVAVEVFEHLRQPGKEIFRIQDVLKIDGNLIIRTLLHDEDHKQFMNWWYREDVTHVSFYSRKTVEYICSRWNFVLKQIVDDCEITLKKT